MQTNMTSYRELFKLYDIIENGHSRYVQAFLQNNSLNINEILPCKGIGILHLAVGIEPIEKSIECTEILLKHGADPNLRSDDGMTPLHIASIWGRTENIKLLIGCGGDPSLRDLDGHSAFDYAAREEQWAVFDYLHNVVDQQDDSAESPCAYSLDLERILVTTDQMVAEYAPLTNQRLQEMPSCRKSELVRDWCDKTTLTMNKLYPTILTETKLIENESVPWKSVDVTLDITHDQPNKSMLDETKTSYKSCLSRKLTPDDLCISGIRILDETADKTKSVEVPKRFSVYENFSLPGSPTNIVHANYNSKTNLKKTKSSSHCNRVAFADNTDEKSLMTSDSSDCLNDAMAVIENKRNEWLSSSGSRDSIESSDYNTRRSSASSGVSSSFSGGNITVASVEEEYKYEDKEEHVVLIEKRLLVSTVVLPVEDEIPSSEAEKSIISVASSLPAAVEYDNHTLRTELMRHGFRPGPIDQSTRTLYLKKLRSLRRNPIVVTSQGKTYSIELEKSLKSDEWTKDLSKYETLESKVRSDFANPTKKWREGSAKTSFTYLLLDPRLTNNLPANATKQSTHESWVTFVNSIFYVGKGKRSRPYSHLYQALTLWKRNFTTSKDKKVQHILDIWTEKVGVVCLHVFQNVIPAEAFTNEAAMIDVLGVTNLKNLKTGNYYGVAASWPLKDRRMLGLYLLYKAMLIFVSEGERQLRPDDID